MGTDATGVIEVDVDATSARPARRTGLYPWATVAFDRDYLLFDLLGGGRSCNPDDAVVPMKEGTCPGVTAWLRAAELVEVARVYRQRTGADNRDLCAVIAAMQALNDGVEERTRLLVSFCS